MALTDDAIDRIKAMILSGRLRPGERLPNAADLAAALGLSRNTLREALRALALIRVLEVRHGDGIYVGSLQPRQLFDTLGFVTDFYRDGAAPQVLELRRALEPTAVALAAGRMTDGDTAKLRALADALADGSTVDELVAHEQEFHGLVAAAAGNDVLRALVDGLSGPTTRARLRREAGLPQAVAATRQDHRSIAEAIAARRPELAQAWATVHLAR
ncbi:FadR/GntR family transcriptional regulator [Phytohabitans houttuyneae]|uniref:GntR family transcriptional regulator n=1 Tax=Phytohabitans houttuyneae TaxID=1076126 RepID=A0A6V8KGF5_9ACTN|nr:FCD domain-containing protein [Phytohabitans houttuyneae]GFJ82894.1 GntR family transcriptional regulator [Phytohabitans houttuyneae]